MSAASLSGGHGATLGGGGHGATGASATYGAALGSALGGSLGAGTTRLGGALGGLAASASVPTLLPSAATHPPGLHPRQLRYVKCDGNTVSERSLLTFLFPPEQENPDSCGRLELFARFGPADEEGHLRGGPSGCHLHTNSEVGEMVRHNCREELFRQILKPRSDSEAIVDSLLPFAMESSRYTMDEVRRLLRKVPTNEEGRMDFSVLQRTVLESQTRRLKVIVKRAEGGRPIAPPKERPLRVPFQSKPAAMLMEIAQRKKYGSDQAEELAMQRRQHSYCGLVAPMDQKDLGRELRANVTLVRTPGDLNDRWDRYCAVRRTGRSSYVNARNNWRANPSLDDHLGNKHPGVSSLLVASAGGSSAAAQLAA